MGEDQAILFLEVMMAKPSRRANRGREKRQEKRNVRWFGKPDYLEKLDQLIDFLFNDMTVLPIPVEQEVYQAAVSFKGRKEEFSPKF